MVIGNRLLADIPLVFYPFLTQIADAFSTGTFPLWSTRLYTGHPFFASFQSALLSPFTWIAVAVPLPWGTVAGAAARVLAGGARRLALRAAHRPRLDRERLLRRGLRAERLQHRLARTSALGRRGLAAVAALGADGVVGGRRSRATAILAGVVALTVFAGHPETALKVLACGGLYGLARPPPARGLGAAAWVTLGYALGLLISAVQVVPFAEYLQASRAHVAAPGADEQPLRAARRVAVTAVVPDFWGHPVSQDYVAHANRAGMPANYDEQQTYPGVVTWVLACVGLATVPGATGESCFFALAAVFSAALAFGTPSALEPLTSLPVLRMTLLSRFGFLVIASAIVLGAIGLDALVRSRTRRRRGSAWAPSPAPWPSGSRSPRPCGRSRRAGSRAPAAEGRGRRALLGAPSRR